jgi:hypothetical protein
MLKDKVARSKLGVVTSQLTTVNLQRQEMIISGVTTKDRTVVGQEISNNTSPGRTFERQEVSKSGIATMGQ